MALTDLYIRQLPKPENGRIEIRDSKTPGLWLRVSGTGNKSFVVRGYIEGDPVRKTLGKYPLLSLRDARSQALALQSLMQRGVDPRLGSRDRSTKFSLSQALAEYAKFMRRKGEATSRPSVAYRREVDRLLKKEFGSKLGSRDIREISKMDIMRIVYDVLDRPRKSGGVIVAEECPSAANHALSYVKTFFAWCEGQGYIDTDITQRLISPAPKNKRDRVLDDQELKAIWYAACELGHPYGDIVRLLLVSGQRRSEIARLRRSDLDFEQELWKVSSKNKTGRPYSMPLSPSAISLLQSIPQASTSLLFGAPTQPNREFSAWSKNKRKLDQISGVSNFVIHDLRRTAATNLVRLGIAPHVRERVLNHVIPGVEGVYDRYSWLNEKRKALETYDAFLQDLFATE